MSRAGGKDSGKLLPRVVYLLGLGTLLGILVFFFRIWSWEPSQLSRELLVETGRALGCKLQVRETEVRRFPFPRVLWHEVSLLLSRDAHARLQSLGASPDLLSMAVGKPQVSRLELAGLEASEESWKELLEGLWESIPGKLRFPLFEIIFSNARVKTKFGGGETLLLSHLEGRLKQKFSGVGFKLNFDLESVEKSLLLRGVALDFSSKGGPGWTLAGRISIDEPLLEFTAELRGLSINGFDEFVLLSPSLDIASAKALLQLSPELSGLFPELWELPGAGKILDLKLKIPGRDSALFPGDSGVEVRARLKGAQVLLPGPWGSLKDLEAQLRISQGTLELSSIRANTEAGSLKAGSLRLGLATQEPALLAEVWFEADMKQLHRILEEGVREEPWGPQIRAFYRVGGKARGKLLLQGSAASPRAWLEVQELVFLARHKDFPYVIQIRGGSLLAGAESISFQGLGATLGSSSFSRVSGSLDLSGEPWLDLRAGSSVLELEEIWALLEKKGAALGFKEKFSSLEGRFRIQEAELNGPLLEPEAWMGRGSGRLEGRIALELLGVELELRAAELEFARESLSFKKVDLNVGGENLYLEGELLQWLDDERTGRVSIRGEIGPEIWELLREPLAKFTGMSWRELPRAELLHSKINWSPQGAALEAELSWEGEMHVSGELFLEEGGFRIRRLRLQGAETDLVFSFETGGGGWELSLEGKASGNVLDFFTEENPLGGGWVKGTARLRRDPSEGFMFTGEMTAGRIPLARFLGGGPWELVEGKVLGKGRDFFLDSARLNRRDKEVFLRGEGSLVEEGPEIKATLEIMSLTWEELGEMTQELTSGLGESLTTTLGLRLGELQVEDTSIRPFHADLRLDPSGSWLDLKYAVLCGVNISGKIQMSEGLRWSFHPVVRALELKRFLGCLGVSSIGFTGKADLDGEIWGEGFEVHSREKAGGSLKMLFHEGEIQESRLWPRILEALRGLPEFREWLKKAQVGAIPLEKGRTNLELNRGNLKIKEFWFKGTLMEVLAQGEVDLFSGGLQMVILLEPKGVKPKGSREKKQGVIAALALEGSFQEPLVQKLNTGKLPKELLEKLNEPKAPKSKARSSQKKGKPAAK